MQKSLSALLLSVSLFLMSTAESGYSQGLDRPPDASEVDYAPVNGELTSTNPPFFRWLPESRAASYILQYSRSGTFDSQETATVRDIDMTVHIPTEVMEPGTWYWRYGYNDGSRDRHSRIRRFEIPESAVEFPLIPVDDVISRIPEHRPRLYFTPEQVKEIRSDMEGRYAHITKGVIDAAEEVLTMNEPLFVEPLPWEEYEDYRPVYGNAWRTMRPYTQRMVTSALAWLYTGDERFAEEAKRRLMHFMTWDVEGASSTIWPTELGMDIAQNTPLVFDWIYETLSEEERELCKTAIGARMQQINRDIHRARPMEARPFSSHPGRMVGFVIGGSIALAHEDPRARDWLDYTLKLMWSTYPAWGGAPGGWSEGVSYWTSYMSRMIQVVNELDRLGIPIKNKPFFQNTGYFGLYAAYPGRQTRSFGDGYESPVGSSGSVNTYILSNLYENPWFRWHSEQTGGGVVTGPAAFSSFSPDLEARPPDDLPQSHLFEDVGLVAMHSKMADPAENILMLFQSNPFGAISHNHANQNAFVIEAFGEPLAISTGYYQNYGSPHHREWNWQTRAHNSILVDGEGQVPRTRNSRGKIISYEEHGDYVYASGDATDAYGKRLKKFHRHVLFIRPGSFVIIDDLQTAGQASTYQWLMHAPTEIQVDQDSHITVSRSGNARLTTRFLAPDRIEFQQHTGFTPQVRDSGRVRNQFHLTASTSNPESSNRFVTVMMADRTHDEPAMHPESPGTPRRQLQLRDISDRNTLDQSLLQAELLDAEGGIALRIGNDLILWKEPGSWRVKAAGTTSTRNMKYLKDYFI